MSYFLIVLLGILVYGFMAGVSKSIASGMNPPGDYANVSAGIWPLLLPLNLGWIVATKLPMLPGMAKRLWWRLTEKKEKAVKKEEQPYR